MNPIIEYENLNKTNSLFFEKYKQQFNEFLESGWFVLGQGVTDFEKAYASYCDANHCAGVASGLDALILAIDAFAFPPGSEIIVPSNTYIATIMAIVRNGFKPVLVEPDIRTYNIDAAKIEQCITSKTVAILVVHLYGKACEMGIIMDLANTYGLKVIEDVAQAQGAMYKKKVVGSFGVGCHSFYPTKNLGALGDGGAITCSDKMFIDKVRQIRNYGSSKKYVNDLLGYNSRLDELQARFLHVKLSNIHLITEHKRNLADIYNQNLSNAFIKPNLNDDYYDVYHIYNIRHKNRDGIRSYLDKEGIKTEIHYPIPPHRQLALQGVLDGNYPISEEIHQTTISLPIAFFHTADDIFRVVETLNRYVK